MAERNSAVFVWSDRALFVGDRSETAPHAHNALELCVAFDDLGVSYRTPRVSLAGIAGALLACDVTHQLTIPGPKVAVLYVEPRSAIGAGLLSRLGEDDALELSREQLGVHRDRLSRLFRDDTGLRQAGEACDALLATLAPVPARPRIDRRIRQAMALLTASLADPPGQAAIAAEVGLSAGRFGHLFTEQVGVPMRRWVAWMRLRAALTEALGGASMTSAAHAAGFADAAHFTRTCRKMFGLAPTAFAPVDALFVGS